MVIFLGVIQRRKLEKTGELENRELLVKSREPTGGQMRMNAKKKEKTRRETTAIKVWVTPAEKAAITVKADGYSLSASTYLRELALRSTRPPTRPGEKINHRGKRTDLQRVRTKVLKRAKHR